MAVSELDLDVRSDLRSFTRAWWLFLVGGIAWIFVGFFVLQFDLDSVTTIGLLTGIVLLFAAIDEGVAVFTMPGWRWVHGLLAVLFLFGGIWALAYPGQTFGTLALLIGWYLLIKGSFDVAASLMSRSQPLWGLMLAAGLAQIALAFWAVGHPGRSAWLLVLWVGLGALGRGIGEIVVAFQVRSLHKELAR